MSKTSIFLSLGTVIMPLKLLDWLGDTLSEEHEGAIIKLSRSMRWIKDDIRGIIY